MTMHSGHEYGRVTIVAQWNEIIFELVFKFGEWHWKRENSN